MDQFTELTDVLSPEEKKLFEEWVTSPTKVITLKCLKGHNIIPLFSAEGAEFAYNKWEMKKGDVFLAAFPKTGATWVFEIIRCILYHQKRSWIKMNRSFPMELLFLEYGGVKKFSVLDKLPMSRRIFATHLPLDLFNLEKAKKVGAKVIYLYRNPKDQIVNWLRFFKRRPKAEQDLIKELIGYGWENYLDHVLKGNFHTNMKPGEWYPEHILSWYPHRDNKIVYFVAYEDLRKNLLNEIKKLSDFLETPLDDDAAAEIAETCNSFKLKENEKSSEGNIGEWKDHFTVSQSERVDSIIKEKLKDTDIEFSYE